ncbi:MAG: CoA transferase subunit A, partial [Candidatus Geothermarchaeales archaeon]
RFVSDGDKVFVGGFGNLYPFALAHEVIRQGRKNLTLCKHSPELIGDQLIGARCVKKLVFSWLGNPGVGSSHCLRRAVEKGKPQPVELEEYTHAATTGMLRAGAMGLPFLPTKAILGSDIPKQNRKIKFMDCPYTGEKLCLIPSLNPDVALIHAQRADTEGNVQVWGVTSDIQDGALASKKIIVSVEEVVESEVTRRDPNRTLIPGFMVDAVVHEPWGAHPSSAQGFYDRDNDYFIRYNRWTKSLEGFETFLKKWVYGVKNRREYVHTLGIEAIMKLKPKPYPCFEVDYGYYE